MNQKMALKIANLAQAINQLYARKQQWAQKQISGNQSYFYPCMLDQSMVAITFNSMAIGVGKQFISKVVLHGGSMAKYSAHNLL